MNQVFLRMEEMLKAWAERGHNGICGGKRVIS